MNAAVEVVRDCAADDGMTPETGAGVRSPVVPEAADDVVEVGDDVMPLSTP